MAPMCACACVCMCAFFLSQEMGIDWSIREGYAWVEDKEHCEEYGRMLQADPTKVRKAELTSRTVF